MQDEIFDKCKLDVCPRGPLVTDNDSGEILCASCGQVLIEKIDSMASETRSFDLEQFPSLFGLKINFLCYFWKQPSTKGNWRLSPMNKIFSVNQI